MGARSSIIYLSSSIGGSGSIQAREHPCCIPKNWHDEHHWQCHYQYEWAQCLICFFLDLALCNLPMGCSQTAPHTSDPNDLAQPLCGRFLLNLSLLLSRIPSLNYPYLCTQLSPLHLYINTIMLSHIRIY